MKYFDEVLIVSKALKDYGAKVHGFTQNGPDDSTKIQVTVSGNEFEVAVEAVDNLVVMYPNYSWTYGHNSAAEAHNAMLKWEA